MNIYIFNIQPFIPVQIYCIFVVTEFNAETVLYLLFHFGGVSERSFAKSCISLRRFILNYSLGIRLLLFIARPSSKWC